MSNVGQRVAPWPDLPHEKYFTSDQSRRTGRGLKCWFGICLSSKKVCNLVSNFFGSAGAGETGFLEAAFSVKSCTNLSNADGSGALAVEVALGVNISTNFLSNLLLSSTERSGLFTVTARNGSGSLLDHIRRISRLRFTDMPS